MTAAAKSIPTALTIAGSDSGGGAGIQADLKTFLALNVHGTCVLTSVTAQNPGRILAIEPCSPAMIRAQLDAVFAELRPAAVKVGMLYTSSSVEVVARFFQRGRRPPLIIDPVKVATSGAKLARTEAWQTLCDRLLPLAALVTPNVLECEALLATKISSLEELRVAARELHRRFGTAILAKGGHVPDTRAAVDFYFDGEEEWMLSAPFIRGGSLHGTGCTYAAAIAGYLARGHVLLASVRLAKNYISNAIAQRQRTGGHDLLNHQPVIP